MTLAPAAEASCIAKHDTPPVPCVRTVLPFSNSSPLGPSRREWYNALTAVTPAVGRAAASSKLRFLGILLNHLSSTTQYCCNVPCMSAPPSALSISNSATSSLQYQL